MKGYTDISIMFGVRLYYVWMKSKVAKGEIIYNKLKIAVRNPAK